MHFLQHYSGQSSQIPSGSAVEEQFRSYFLAAKKMEESPSLFQDGSTSQTPPIETPTVDAAATGAPLFILSILPRMGY